MWSDEDESALFQAFEDANAADASFFASADYEDAQQRYINPLDSTVISELDELFFPVQETSSASIFQALEDANAADASFFTSAEQEDALQRHVYPMDSVEIAELDDLLSTVLNQDQSFSSVAADHEMTGGSDPVLLQAHQNGSVQIVQHPVLKMTEHRTNFNIHHALPNNTVDILTLGIQIDNHFDNIIEPIISTAEDNDIISIVLSHPSLVQGSLYSYCYKHRFSSMELTNKIAKVVQSRAEFLPHGQFSLDVGILKNTSGGAKPRAAPETVAENRENCKSLIQIYNNNKECGHFAIYIADFRLRFDWRCIDKKEWEKLRKCLRAGFSGSYLFSKCTERIDEMNQVYKDTPLDIDKPVDLTALELYAEFLDKQIVVYKSDEGNSRQDASLFFISNVRKTQDKTIFLEMHTSTKGNHFNVITNIAGYLKKAKYCFVCYQALSTPRNHFCRVGCPGCNSDNVCAVDETVFCAECNRKCNSRSCLQKHSESDNCKLRLRCQTCHVFMPKSKEKKHKCFVYECSHCQQTYTDSPHFCYMKPLKVDSVKDANNIVIVSFDIESKFVQRLGTTYHEPDLLCSLIVCNKCYLSANVREQDADGSFLPLKNDDCETCLQYRKEFHGRSCVKDFGDYLYSTLGPKVNKQDPDAVIRVFAHNFKGYDGRFVLRDLFNRQMESQKLIMQGSKITCLKVANITFQDSLNLFQCALSKLPKSFNFEHRCMKGMFPFLFNTPDNEGYIGKTPDISFYGYDSKNPADQDQLRKFHATVADRIDFDLEKEKLEYCRDDTEILLIAIQEFRRTFKEVAHFDPIRDYFTLPSMSYGGFRRSFLQANTIGITPTAGYGKKRKHSKIADCWLDAMEKEIGREIKREFRLGYIYADGFDKETKTAYEFNGCRWHGCPKCFPHERDRKQAGMTMTLNQAFTAYEERREYYNHLKKAIPELSLHEIWECQLKTQRRSKAPKETALDGAIKNRWRYYNRLEELGGVVLRESYFGGRTNNRKFFKTCDGENEWFEYVDFTSLYPAVLAKYPYMIGHPIVIRDNFDDYLDVNSSSFKKPLFGFVKCRVYPPKQLQFPILPARIHDRLEFVLCSKCADEKSQNDCSHSDEERALVGTFATPELEEALDNGYRIAEIIEILHWDQTSDNLFKPFVLQWLKIKQEASGYPSGCDSELDMQKYVEDYEREQGITLDPAQIKFDPIKREMAKRQLNAFYGKFAQRENMEQAELINTYERMWKLLTDPKVEITGSVTTAINSILMNWRYINNEEARQGIVNVAIASFITSYARRELWRAMNKIETISPGSVYYFDTDSIIYLVHTGMELLPTGQYLGDLTREVGHGEKIVQLVCLGPKNYAYTVRKVDGSEYAVIKVKGITLTAAALDILTISELTRIAEQYCLNPNDPQITIPIQQNRIVADPAHQTVVNQEMTKIYRAVSEKRMIRGNDTLPFGWVSDDLAEHDPSELLDAFIAFLSDACD